MTRRSILARGYMYKREVGLSSIGEALGTASPAGSWNRRVCCPFRSMAGLEVLSSGLLLLALTMPWVMDTSFIGEAGDVQKGPIF
jgi:hypothetical protein